jgi:hypothetical protein
MTEKLLSIVICSVPERVGFLSRLFGRLGLQIKGKPVELLVLTDNRSMSIGEKRQYLLELAKGKYICHVDDDDLVSDDYVDSLLEKIKEDKYDCITFTCMVSINGGKAKPCYYSKDFIYSNFPDKYLRNPNHLSCYKREIALKHKFTNLEYGEDDEWGKRASKDIKTECVLDKVLYHYEYLQKSPNWYKKN